MNRLVNRATDPLHIRRGRKGAVLMHDPAKRDLINHPPHYTAGRVECIDYIEAQGFGYHEGNIVKYVTRYKHKNGVDDLKKAQWYLARLIAVIEEGENGWGGGQDAPEISECHDCNDNCGDCGTVEEDVNFYTRQNNKPTCTTECLKDCPTACTVQTAPDNGWDVDCSKPVTSGTLEDKLELARETLDSQEAEFLHGIEMDKRLEVARETLDGLKESCPEKFGCANHLPKATHVAGSWGNNVYTK